ncbi:hypothetical protein PIB30_035638 [Stylosanthes scabra]|uniref:Uncharacterized protein n=1 Tax=Stylosanthes scabra TaxID=79078 RepID=A0ABU6ZA06_9FABA|nr:hypothetical protein [Stylosanthes scabra]
MADHRKESRTSEGGSNPQSGTMEFDVNALAQFLNQFMAKNNNNSTQDISNLYYIHPGKNPEQERQLNGAESTRILLNLAQGKAPTQSSDCSVGRGRGKGRGKMNSGGRGRGSKMMCSYCGKQ